MLGNIISIEDNTVLLKLAIDITKFQSLINLHVVMSEPNRKIIGEISDVKQGIAYINLLGEFFGERFEYGIIKKPSFSARVTLVPKDKVSSIISVEDYDEVKDLYIGDSPIYDGIKIAMNMNDFFANHFAIFGNTGSGKSCGVSRIIQNLFTNRKRVPLASNLFIFDAYGEYHSAFRNLNNENSGVHFKAYTTDVNNQDPNVEILSIPLWLLGVDDICLLLGVDKPTQIPIVEKALKLVGVFAQEEEKVIKIKNDIIVRVILDILTSGKTAAQIRDQITSILSNYNTSQLNLNTEIFQPGYVRPLKQCLYIDASGKIRDLELVTKFLEQFLLPSYELNLPDGSFKYTLEDLKDAFAFALISEGSLTSTTIYDENNTLRVRLNTLASSDNSRYFNYPEYITRKQYIDKLLTTRNGEKAQIINFNINYVDDRLAKTITKIYSKMLFDRAKESKVLHEMPFHIILEEAHRYVQNDNDVAIFGYNIFERITKEGRKYGVLLGLISQRPSELSETALSQCSNFLVFKMVHPRDVEYIKEMVPNITTSIIKTFKILQPGNCVAFGSAFKVPVIIKLQMPNPAPSSSSCDISMSWFKN